MVRRKVVLLHGYSSNADSLGPWRDALIDRGYAIEDIRLGDYISLSNEITIRDIAEGFDRALREQGGLGRQRGVRRDRALDRLARHSGVACQLRGPQEAPEAPHRARARELRQPAWRIAAARCWAPSGKAGATTSAGPTSSSPATGSCRRSSSAARTRGTSHIVTCSHPPTPIRECGRASSRSTATTPTRRIRSSSSARSSTACANLVIHEEGYDGTVRWAGAALDTRKLVIDLTRLPPRAQPRPLPTTSAYARNRARARRFRLSSRRASTTRRSSRSPAS